MDPVTRIMWLIGLSLGAVGVTVAVLGHMPEAPASLSEAPPMAREFPLWCHNRQHEELSGVCSKVKVDWHI